MGICLHRPLLGLEIYFHFLFPLAAGFARLSQHAIEWLSIGSIYIGENSSEMGKLNEEFAVELNL